MILSQIGFGEGQRHHCLEEVMEDGDDLDTLLGDTLGYTGGGPKLVREKEEDNE